MKLLKASTLIETLIAMTILLIISMLAFVIFAKVITSGISHRKMQASVLLEKYRDSTLENVLYYSDSYISGVFIIRRTVVPSVPFSNLLDISYSVAEVKGDSIFCIRELTSPL